MHVQVRVRHSKLCGATLLQSERMKLIQGVRVRCKNREISVDSAITSRFINV